VGEDRARTERDESRDRPGDEMVRVTVAEAARSLDMSEAGVRKRVQRRQIPHERDDDGRLFVWISPGETRHAASRDEAEESRDEAALVEEVRDRLRFVERQLEAERQAHGETRRLLLSALEKIPPAIEASSEPPEAPTEATEQPGRVEAQAQVEGTQDPAKRPWWRRWFE
jgi:hypothetical protein